MDLQDPRGHTTPDEKPIRWGTIIPLIGGSAVGCFKSTGVKPLFHLSYGHFAGHDKHIRR